MSTFDIIMKIFEIRRCPLFEMRLLIARTFKRYNAPL